MGRTLSWFSCGAASAVATKLSKPDEIVYCDTGSEDKDNYRFMRECMEWFGQPIVRLKNKAYSDTWELWEKTRYLSGVHGAECTRALKVLPRLSFQKPNDTHIFGYTDDLADKKRAKILQDNWPDLDIKTPLIEKGLTKQSCLAMLQNAGIEPPRVYAMGFPNANCIPCVKATSSNYWALVRKHFPEEFNRMAVLSSEHGVRLTRIKGERKFIDEIPESWPAIEAISPECDFLCSLATEELEE